MSVLWLHLDGGKTLSVVLPDDEARRSVDAIRDHWRTPRADEPEIGLGEGDQISLWVRYDAISAVELHPADPTEKEPT